MIDGRVWLDADAWIGGGASRYPVAVEIGR